MGRGIPSLHALCLRVVASNECNTEKTFAPCKKRLSLTSKLLRSFHSKNLDRMPCAGKGNPRRVNANDVDINHPFIAVSSTDDGEKALVPEYGNPALDCLQTYLDALAEMGRLDDSRLANIHFWKEWKANARTELDPPSSASTTRKRKRSAKKIIRVGSLSLCNGGMGSKTIDCMVQSGVGPHLGVLDLTGSHGLTDDSIAHLLSNAPNLRRLSLKNCRRLTNRSLETIAKYLTELTCLDIGGCYNMNTHSILAALPSLSKLEELYANGLSWTDGTLQELSDSRAWKGLGIGFSPHLTSHGLKAALASQTLLERLTAPFCETGFDSSVLGDLGKQLMAVSVLDIRGNPISSLTPWFDGRVGNNGNEALFVLARYSNIVAGTIEETKRVHPIQAADLHCVLDGTGTGEGIRR